VEGLLAAFHHLPEHRFGLHQQAAHAQPLPALARENEYDPRQAAFEARARRNARAGFAARKCFQPLGQFSGGFSGDGQSLGQVLAPQRRGPAQPIQRNIPVTQPPGVFLRQRVQRGAGASRDHKQVVHFFPRLSRRVRGRYLRRFFEHHVRIGSRPAEGADRRHAPALARVPIPFVRGDLQPRSIQRDMRVELLEV